jgi:predicted glycoside hydrolase/deacetylase ChbG (UPF0249 family)
MTGPAGMLRPLILNADDYAMDGAVDEAVLDLIGRGRVRAASAMVLAPRWKEAAADIRQVDADCGLHVDFSSDFALSRFGLPRLPQLIARAYAGGLRPDRIRAAVDTQLDLYEDAIGRPPDFVDGHQHVHQLPAIRHALMDAIAARYHAGAKHVGIRVCRARSWRGAKAHLIGRLGSAPLARLAARAGHPTSSDFLGVYAFSPAAPLPVLWERWLSALAGQTPLAMCHVAAEGRADPSDPIRPARLKEHAWLASDAFAELCARKGVTLSRWPRGEV